MNRRALGSACGRSCLSSLAAHGLRRIVAGCVAAVAAEAREALLGMDVLAEFFLRDSEIAFHSQMAIET